MTTTCAVRDGAVYCWGQPFGTRDLDRNIVAPERVPGLAGVDSVSVFEWFSLRSHRRPGDVLGRQSLGRARRRYHHRTPRAGHREKAQGRHRADRRRPASHVRDRRRRGALLGSWLLRTAGRRDETFAGNDSSSGSRAEERRDEHGPRHLHHVRHRGRAHQMLGQEHIRRAGSRTAHESHDPRRCAGSGRRFPRCPQRGLHDMRVRNRSRNLLGRPRVDFSGRTRSNLRSCDRISTAGASSAPAPSHASDGTPKRERLSGCPRRPRRSAPARTTRAPSPAARSTAGETAASAPSATAHQRSRSSTRTSSAQNPPPSPGRLMPTSDNNSPSGQSRSRDQNSSAVENAFLRALGAIDVVIGCVRRSRGHRVSTWRTRRQAILGSVDVRFGMPSAVVLERDNVQLCVRRRAATEIIRQKARFDRLARRRAEDPSRCSCTTVLKANRAGCPLQGDQGTLRRISAAIVNRCRHFRRTAN